LTGSTRSAGELLRAHSEVTTPSSDRRSEVNTPYSSMDGMDEEEAAVAGQNKLEAMLEEEGIEALLLRVPRDENGELTSVGAILHDEGSCRPCVFAHNERKACENSTRCLFCHFEHAPKRRLRFGKKKRMEMKRLAEQEFEQESARTVAWSGGKMPR